MVSERWHKGRLKGGNRAAGYGRFLRKLNFRQLEAGCQIFKSNTEAETLVLSFNKITAGSNVATAISSSKIRVFTQLQTAFCPYLISVMPPTAAAQPATSEICSGSPKNHAEDSTPKIGTSVIYAAALPAPKVFTPSKYHA